MAVGVVLLAGGGYVYLQQLQAQQKARLRYVDSTLHQADGDSLVLWGLSQTYSKGFVLC